MKTIIKQSILILIILLFLAYGALAEDGENKPPDPFSSLVRLAASMAIVIGLILGAAFATKKLFARARFSGSQDNPLHIRQTVGLGAKRQVFVFEIGESMLVVGASGEGMRLLAKLPRAAEHHVEPPAMEQGAAFEEVLRANAAGTSSRTEAP